MCEPFIFENAKSLVDSLYGSSKRYDLGAVGRYKFNQKMGLGEKLVGQKVLHDIVVPGSKKPLVKAGEILTPKIVAAMVEAKVPAAKIETIDGVELNIKRSKTSYLVFLDEGEGLNQNAHEGVCVCGDIVDAESGETIITDGAPLDNETIFRLNDRKAIHSDVHFIIHDCNFCFQVFL